MPFFAAMFETHGLKILHAATAAKAAKAFTTNAGGVRPVWVAHVLSGSVPTVMQMRRLGWHGTKEAFRAEIDPLKGIDL